MYKNHKPIAGTIERYYDGEDCEKAICADCGLVIDRYWWIDEDFQKWTRWSANCIDTCKGGGE